MKYGIYYAYWEKEWGGDFRPYVEKVKGLGYDVLEIACGQLLEMDTMERDELCALAKANEIRLTGGFGPPKKYNIATGNLTEKQMAIGFYTQLYKTLEKMNIRKIGGGLYTYWPVDYSFPIDKAGDWERSVKVMQLLADRAADCGVTLCMESLNRFEGYLINTAAEALEYVRQVDRPNVQIHLDTFHMNIEEDSFTEAIHTAGKYLGHFHVGEANRKVPGQGRMPWAEIAQALKDIQYEGDIVLEPFVLRGGQVGKDIKIWRDLVEDSPEVLDRDAAQSVAFLRALFD